jgi:DNA-binding transcriptional regulator YiaG
MARAAATQHVTRTKRVVGAKTTSRGTAAMDAPRASGIAGRKRIVPAQLRALRADLSPDPKKPLSQQRLSQLLGVAWSTVARWEAGGSIEARHAVKLVRLQRVLTLLDEMVAREHRLAFFEQPHPLLLELRPIDLLDTEEGTAAVSRQLEAAASGAFA